MRALDGGMAGGGGLGEKGERAVWEPCTPVMGRSSVAVLRERGREGGMESEREEQRECV